MNKKKILPVILIFSIVILAILVNRVLYLEHKKELYQTNDKIISYVVEKHPELKEEIINILFDSNYNYESVLKEYGFKDYKNIELFTNLTLYKNKLILYNFSFISLICIIGISIYLKKKIHMKHEINKIINYMGDVLSGNYALDIRDYKEDDLSLLKNDIYKLVIKLKENALNEYKNKVYLKDFLQDVSHQLKTPLTSMYVINDILVSEKDEKKRHDFIKKNKMQLERIEWLISSLLKLSLLDNDVVVLKEDDVNIGQMIEDAISPVKIPIELKNINLNIKGDKNLIYKLDSKWTSEAILNIVKNSYEHTNESGNINIYFSENPLYLLIKISDDGEGIKSKDIKNIFTRFYRTANSEGVGIGLNMSKKIIEKQNGEIIVRSIEKRGTTFEIRFYKRLV